ncbi:hypothetical protein FACS18949_06720 [Clostridia bacterium]|nr:hypothetical protein FACS18949_06720 [Clostridia bacterium]
MTMPQLLSVAFVGFLVLAEIVLASVLIRKRHSPNKNLRILLVVLLVIVTTVLAVILWLTWAFGSNQPVTSPTPH